MNYTVSFERNVDGEERHGHAPVDASSEEEAEERFLEQVENEQEFTVTEVSA